MELGNFDLSLLSLHMHLNSLILAGANGDGGSKQLLKCRGGSEGMLLYYVSSVTLSENMRPRMNWKREWTHVPIPSGRDIRFFTIP